MTEPDDADGAAAPAADAADTPPTPPENSSATGRTVTSQPHRGAPVRTALLCGAALNLTALAILATILLDGPLRLAITLTVATALLAIAARHTIRSINTDGEAKPIPPQQINR